MIRVHTGSSRDTELITREVGFAEYVVGRLDAITRDHSDAECFVLGLRGLIDDEMLRLVRELGRDEPLVPIILVVDEVSAVATSLAERAVSAVLTFREIEHELRPRIDMVCRTAVLRMWAESIRAASALPPVLRPALMHSLYAAADRPVRTVKDLAAAVGNSPVTLSQAYRAGVVGDATLGQFLSALVILRAHQLRTSGLTWRAVESKLDYGRTTLHRKSKKWPGLTLGQLARTTRQDLLVRFDSDYMQPLLNGSANGSSSAPE